jgi:threonine/homoserine/homoserine lactone efflux protein
MPPLDSILAVLLAGFFLSATPGPSMLYVLSHSVGQSPGAGLASAFGLALGGMLLAVATALGLAEVFKQVPSIVVVLRYLGSAYLAWLGANMIWTARKSAGVQLTPVRVLQKPISAIVWQGVIVELLNPKTVLFFALFLPPFVSACQNLGNPSEVRSQLLFLGILVPLTAIPSDIGVAFLGGTLARSINQRQAFRTGMAWVGGLILITIALNLHLGFL